MKITFLSPPFNLSGGMKVIVIYACALQRMGHEVSIVSTPYPSIPFREKLKSLLKGKVWPKHEDYPAHTDGIDLDLRVINSERPITDRDVPDGDVVIATWWETAEWVNALSDCKGAKVYFIQHHEVFPHLPKRSRDTYRLPLHKIVVAQWLKVLMKSEYGDAEVDVVPNSVDHQQFFAPPRGKQQVPTVGLLYSTASFKGLDIALAAFRSVGDNIPDLRLIVFGSEKINSGVRLPHNSKYYFSPAQDKIRDLYSQCDVWLTASRSEGFNLTAMEAMACRTPIVATRTGWPEEAVKSGWNGILANIDDTSALARGVEWILSRDDEDWRHLSTNAYSTVSTTSWDASSKMFEIALGRARRRAAYGEIGGACHSVADLLP